MTKYNTIQKIISNHNNHFNILSVTNGNPIYKQKKLDFQRKNAFEGYPIGVEDQSTNPPQVSRNIFIEYDPVVFEYIADKKETFIFI